MNRLFTKDATGIAPNGRWYAGDINAIQDAVAAQSDFTQTVSLGTVAVGDSSIQLLKYGTGETRMTSAFRTDGVIRGLGGLFAGSFTATQRDAIPGGATPNQRPYGLVILDTTNNRLEWNSGTDASPVWRRMGHKGDGSITFGPDASTDDTILWRPAAGVLQLGTNTLPGRLATVTSAGGLGYSTSTTADTYARWYITGEGSMNWGPGTTPTPDITLSRGGAGQLNLTGALAASSWIVSNDHIQVNQTVATAWAFYTVKGSDTQPMFLTQVSGALNWGPGGSTAPDTTLGRSSPGILDFSTSSSGANGGMRIFTPAAASSMILAYKTTDSQPSFQIVNDGKLNWGAGGTTGLDTNLYRPSAGVLQTDGGIYSARNSNVAFYAFGSPAVAFESVVTATNNVLVNYKVNGDTQPSFNLTGAGIHNWGPGGSTGTDTNLYRGAAGVLASDSSLVSTSQTGGVGYYTGAGGTATVVHGTSVALNRTCMSGKLTASAPVSSGAVGVYTVTGGGWAATDTIIVNHTNGTGSSLTSVTNVGAGSFALYFNWLGTGSLTPTFNFSVVKAVTS